MGVEFGTRKVADIAVELARVQRLQHRCLVGNALAREVQQHRAGAHQADVGLTD